MGGGSDMPQISVPQPVEQLDQYGDMLAEQREEQDAWWQDRMDEVLAQEEEFRAIQDATEEQEQQEYLAEEEQIAEIEEVAQEEVEFLQDTTAPGQDIDEFLYGFYGLIDDEDYEYEEEAEDIY
tara:strand:- start:55 stop:426 length:372 start_codon:yes stop_codon:yes gene_type:complete